MTVCMHHMYSCILHIPRVMRSCLPTRGSAGCLLEEVPCSFPGSRAAGCVLLESCSKRQCWVVEELGARYAGMEHAVLGLSAGRCLRWLLLLWVLCGYVGREEQPREEMCAQQGPGLTVRELLGWRGVGEHREPQTSQEQAVKKAGSPKEPRKLCYPGLRALQGIGGD